jgi:hypothetical protein
MSRAPRFRPFQFSVFVLRDEMEAKFFGQHVAVDFTGIGKQKSFALE